MAVSAVWRLAYFLAPCQAEPRSRPQHTGETRCAPVLKSKSKRLLARETDSDGAPIFTPEFPKADPYQCGKERVARS